MAINPSQKRSAEVLEAEVSPSLPATAGGTVDVQVATARRFPRVITHFLRRATEMATLTPEVAQSCIYAIPRDGKMVEGPSARLAEIVAHAWGNSRIQAGVTDQDARYVTARGEAWDVEANVAIAFEVKRKITNRKGDTFNDDMIVVTGNAAASIALRNAVFKMVPTSFWRPIYDECRKVIAGDAKTFAARCDEMLKAFAIMGVTEDRLCAAIGIASRSDLKLDHIVTLRGFYNALKDGDTTIEEAFPEGGGLGSPKAAPRKSEQAADAKPDPKAEPAATAAAPADARTAEPTAEDKSGPAADATLAAPSQVGLIAKVERAANGAVLILDSGYCCSSRDAELIRTAEQARDSKSRVELVTRPSSDPKKFYPTLEEILPVEEGAQS